MKIIDITVPISVSTPTFPGDPGVEFQQWAAIERGDDANVTILHFGAHTATHVDAPNHFIDGAARVDSMPLSALIGAAVVIELPEEATSISREFLAGQEIAASRVLFKTRNSSFWSDNSQGFRTDFVYLEPEAARLLVDHGVELVGIDYLSIEKYQAGNYDTHHILLSNKVVILEGIDLREVEPGPYELICLPLRLAGGTGDGAPARAVLRTA